MKNEFEIRGDVTAIYLRRKDDSVLETLIDTADLPIAQSFPKTWCVANCQGRLYVHGWLSCGKGSTLRLHRVILDAPPDKAVDHVTHDTLDNRRANLRLATTSQNLQNRRGAASNSSTGIRGVSWRKDHKKWQAQLKVNGRFIHLGYFDDITEADKAVSAARAKLMPYSRDAMNFQEARG